MKAPFSHKLKVSALVLCGLFIGALNGLLGGGGGMLAVPALSTLGDVPTKKAHATAIAVMLPMSVLSAVVYTVMGTYNIGLGWTSCLAVTLGGAGGALLLGRLSKELTSLVFYALMLAAGLYSVLRWFGC